MQMPNLGQLSIKVSKRFSIIVVVLRLVHHHHVICCSSVLLVSLRLLLLHLHWDIDAGCEGLHSSHGIVSLLLLLCFHLITLNCRVERILLRSLCICVKVGQFVDATVRAHLILRKVLLRSIEVDGV